MKYNEGEGIREAAAELLASFGQSEWNYQKTKNSKATCRNSDKISLFYEYLSGASTISLPTSRT
jgi:hypothetical protein